MTGDNSNGLALVMSGGGARAAYQVGFLRGIARHFDDLDLPIITGVSAGAINAAYLANESGTFRRKADALARLWANLDIDQIYRVDTLSVLRNALGWGARLLMGRASQAIHLKSLVDTTPLMEMMKANLKTRHGELIGIPENIHSGRLRAIAITASSYSTGRSVTWIQGREINNWERAHRQSVITNIHLNHILASASLPMFFPAVQVEGNWYGDGGIRLTAPLSPAIHLGGRRLLAISTRYQREEDERELTNIDGYPPPAQVVGAMFNAVFLDLFDNDALRLQRLNELLKQMPGGRYGELQPVKLLLLRPSRDLGRMANEFEPSLPSAFRFMTRGLGTRETRSNDLLSLVMFQPDYINHLLDLGTTDALNKMDEIKQFLRE